MFTFGSMLVLSLAPQGGGSSSTVVINEFSYDDSGTDDREYVELYNRSGGPVDIGNWVLDSDDPFGSNTDFTIPAGTVLQPGDFWVLGSAMVPNVDQVVGTTNIWENSNESLTLRDTGGAIVDTLVYEAWRGLWDPTLAEGEGVWGNATSIDGLDATWSRIRDGWDSDNNGRDFRLVPATPGASNDLPDLLPVAEDFDAGAIGDVVPDWGGSFKPVRIIDPTVVDSLNPNAIPASPAGGNAAIFWDESGGGNHNMLLTDATDRVKLEAWVYFDAVPEPSGERETWSIGVQGTTGTFYNTPDPSGVLGFSANGNTGINWTFEVLDSGATLYLVDNNDGGWPDPAMMNNPLTPATVIGQIPIMPGVNDGWQRLRLEVSAGQATGHFGGTPGFNDGMVLSAPIQGAIGGIWIGYREFVTDNSTVRPVTLDGLTIDTACADLTITGDGFQGSDLTFDLQGGQPRRPALLLIGATTGATTLAMGPLGTLEFGLAHPFVPVHLRLTDANGAAGLVIPVPSNRPVPRIGLYAQGFTADLQVRHGAPPILDICTTDVEGFFFGGSPTN